MANVKRLLAFLCLFAFIGTFIGCIGLLCLQLDTKGHLTYKQFEQAVKVKEKKAVIGTNITLHQKIYGTDKTTYRYKLKTDCHYWKYEDRYLSETPLPMTESYAAVETNAYALTLSYQNVTLATGQFFEVPILELTDNDITYEEFKNNLLHTAYSKYRKNRDKGISISPMQYVIFILLATGLICIYGRNTIVPSIKKLGHHKKYDKDDEMKSKV